METSERREQLMRLMLRDAEVAGDLTLPAQPRGLVLFAHGSGSSRFSPRNRRVASLLVEGGLATLLFDLLTPAEAEEDRNDAHLRFDLPLLTGRLVAAIDGWGRRPELATLPLGLFGASTGAAAALGAAAQRPEVVRAVVSRGGRPDLALERLAQVRCPTLLIVGDRDQDVLRLNQKAAGLLSCPHEIRLIAGASHLFEEGDTLDQVALLARRWFLRNLPPSSGGG